MSPDVHTPKVRSYNMSQIRGEDTDPELRLRSLLHRAGYRFRLHVRNMPGKPDIVLPRYHTVIFVNGCFWHRHEGCKFTTTPRTRKEFWEKKFAETVERDKNNLAKLRASGWNVAVVWECELKADAEEVLKRLTTQLEETQHK